MTLFRRFTFFPCLYFLSLFPAGAQSVTQPIEWFGTTSTIKVSPKLGIYAEGLYRFAKDFQPMQIQFRLGGDFALSQSFSVMPLAYAYTINPVYGDQPSAYAFNEHRIFQQLAFRHSWGKLKFQHRIRTEERFLQSRSNVNGEFVDNGYVNNQFRVRYRLFFTHPFKNEKIVPRSWYFQFYNEVFISFGKSVSPQQPDQNRLFIGLGRQVNPDFSWQFGPFYQIIIKSDGSHRENNVGAQLTFIYNFDLTRKSND